MSSIVILAHYADDGSPSIVYVHKHAVALKKEGYDVTVIVGTSFFPLLKKSKKENHEEVIDGVKIIYKKYISFRNLLVKSSLSINGFSYYLAIKKVFKSIWTKNNSIIIDAHTFEMEGYVAYRLKKKYGVKAYVTLHGSSFNRALYTVCGRKKILKFSKIIDKYICVSDKLYNQLKDLDIVNSNIIYNGIDFWPVKRQNQNHNICFVGNLVPSKNVDILIKSFSIVLKKYDDAKLYIVGDGMLKQDLIKLVNFLNINDSVFFKGFLSNEETFKIMSKCNIFSMVSSPEGFGIVYPESMYCGCIPIGTIGEGIDGFIKNGYNGYLTETKVEKISAIMNEIFSNNVEKIRKNAIEDSKKLSWKYNAICYLKEMKISEEELHL